MQIVKAFVLNWPNNESLLHIKVIKKSDCKEPIIIYRKFNDFIKKEEFLPADKNDCFILERENNHEKKLLLCIQMT